MDTFLWTGLYIQFTNVCYKLKKKLYGIYIGQILVGFNVDPRFTRRYILTIARERGVSPILGSVPRVADGGSLPALAGFAATAAVVQMVPLNPARVAM
jgi:hypothetical protein